MIIGSDPKFNDISSEDFYVPTNSLANGFLVVEPQYDIARNLFAASRSIGAFEGNPIPVFVEAVESPESSVIFYPDPFKRCASIKIPSDISTEMLINLHDVNGKLMASERISQETLNYALRLC